MENTYDIDTNQLEHYKKSNKVVKIIGFFIYLALFLIIIMMINNLFITYHDSPVKSVLGVIVPIIALIIWGIFNGIMPKHKTLNHVYKDVPISDINLQSSNNIHTIQFKKMGFFNKLQKHKLSEDEYNRIQEKGYVKSKTIMGRNIFGKNKIESHVNIL